MLDRQALIELIIGANNMKNDDIMLNALNDFNEQNKTNYDFSEVIEFLSTQDIYTATVGSTIVTFYVPKSWSEKELNDYVKNSQGRDLHKIDTSISTLSYSQFDSLMINLHLEMQQAERKDK